MIWCVIGIMKGMKALLQVQAAGIPLTLVLFVDRRSFLQFAYMLYFNNGHTYFDVSGVST